MHGGCVFVKPGSQPKELSSLPFDNPRLHSTRMSVDCQSSPSYAHPPSHWYCSLSVATMESLEFVWVLMLADLARLLCCEAISDNKVNKNVKQGANSSAE